VVQGHTPDHYLGRVNGLWSAQDAAGDSLGAVGIGAAGKLMSALASIALVGALGLGIGMAMLWGFGSLRRTSLNDPTLQA
jgi:ENTS family enterobactin (siderophore) exporter